MTPLLRYTLVGALATAVHWLLVAALVEGLHVAPWLASGVGAVVGAQVAFAGNRRITFDHRGAALPAWWRFMGTAALAAVCGMAVVAAGVAIGLHYLLAQAIATALNLIVGFAINRRWTFAR